MVPWKYVRFGDLCNVMTMRMIGDLRIPAVGSNYSHIFYMLGKYEVALQFYL